MVRGVRVVGVWEGWEVIGISVVLAYSGLLRICLALLQGEGLKAEMARVAQLKPCLSFHVTVLMGGNLAWSILSSIWTPESFLRILKVTSDSGFHNMSLEYF